MKLRARTALTTILVGLITIALLGSTFPVFAQTGSFAVEERRKQLEAELKAIEKEIHEQQIILDQKRTEVQSVERDIAILNAEIRKAQLEIRARNLAINEISGEISKKESTIGELNEKIGREKQSLAQILRRRNQHDEYSLVEVVLSSEDLSEFFADVDAFETLNVSLQGSLAEIRATQAALRGEQEQLTVKRRLEADVKAEVEAEKRAVERKEDEKQELLAVKKNEEKSYEQVVKEKQRKAAEIRAALFALRDTKAIPFGEAYEFAKAASASTGVRPALILAILTQESNLGENVGQCYLRDPATGGGVGKNTGRWFENVMKASRDVEPFMRIAQNLGFDPFNQVVSCPQSIGYGGAMGPSQFIPSTWEAYEGVLAKALGVSTPNPWEPKHAFTATALYLRDLGAAKGGWSAEREAAARYYAGGYWETRGLGYANSVLAIAQDIQENMINPLEGF